MRHSVLDFLARMISLWLNVTDAVHIGRRNPKAGQESDENDSAEAVSLKLTVRARVFTLRPNIVITSTEVPQRATDGLVALTELATCPQACHDSQMRELSYPQCCVAVRNRVWARKCLPHTAGL